jgi:hypothetical protein
MEIKTKLLQKAFTSNLLASTFHLILCTRTYDIRTLQHAAVTIHKWVTNDSRQAVSQYHNYPNTPSSLNLHYKKLHSHPHKEQQDKNSTQMIVDIVITYTIPHHSPQAPRAQAQKILSRLLSGTSKDITGNSNYQSCHVSPVEFSYTNAWHDRK